MGENKSNAKRAETVKETGAYSRKITHRNLRRANGNRPDRGGRYPGKAIKAARHPKPWSRDDSAA